MNTDQTKTVGLLAVVVLGMMTAVALARWLDSHRPAVDPNIEDESLYMNGQTAKRTCLAFNSLAADWYWMRSLQYVGRKVLSLGENVELDSLAQLNLKLLPSLLDTATTLDPQFMEVYEYTAVVLPAVDVDQAIRLTQKGIDANPNAWRLYQHLGYIYWQRKNFQAAADAYNRGASLPGAPAFMQAMKGKMTADGGSRSTAREIYTQMYEETTDTKVKDMASRRLMQLDSLDERDSLQKVLAAFQQRVGRCPTSWKELEPVFRGRVKTHINGAPLDPSGAPYVLKANCEIVLDPNSEIPAK